MFFWDGTPCRYVDIYIDVSEKHTVSIFRAEVAVLRSGVVYISLGSE
jgi:hypothetical protein